jgi:5-methylcytosine-specific restriction endonuclease McrA
MFVLRGRLTPEVGAVLKRALEAASDRLYSKARVNDPESDPPLMSQQQADAIGMIAEAALHHDLDPGAPGERYQVVVHVDAPTLADPDQPGQSALEDGEHVSAETSRRLACDASRVVMRHDAAGHLVEIGARTRTIPPSLRRALQARDHGCRFPGCGLPFTQGHHIRHWAQAGPTTLSNLTLLCRRHHRSVHEDGFRVERLPDGELAFRMPNGRPLPAAPARPWFDDDALDRLYEQNAAAGVDVYAHTLTSGWTGERFSVAHAIEVMHPLARRPSPRAGGEASEP